MSKQGIADGDCEADADNCTSSDAVEGLDGITPFTFGSGKFHEGGDGFAFIIMRLNHHLSTIADPAPLTNKAGLPEQILLHAQPVEASHVAGGVDPPQMQVGWEHFKLERLIEHIVIQ